jgi:hypothetical protein
MLSENQIPIVNRFFRANDGLKLYLSSLNLTDWKPEFVVLHNTGAPTLAQRPQGFLPQHMINLAEYYSGLGWHAGPHFFCDQNGIWAFSRADRPGVHSPSWNEISWGVEMLGDYDSEDFASGPGALVAENAVFLLAALSQRAGLDSHTMRLHRWDPKTSHKDCPGGHVSAGAVIGRVHALLASWASVPRQGLTGAAAGTQQQDA